MATQSRLWMEGGTICSCVRRVWCLWIWGDSWGGQPPVSMWSVLLPYHRSFGWSTLSLVSSAGARTIASLLGFPLAPPLEITPYWGVQPEAFSVSESNRQIVDRSRQRRISLRWLETFADLSLGLVLVKAGLGVQLGTFCMHPGEATTNYGSLVASKRLMQASHRQCLILVCTRVLPKRPRSNTPRDQLQITLEKNPVSFTSSMSKERS